MLRRASFGPRCLVISLEQKFHPRVEEVRVDVIEKYASKTFVYFRGCAVFCETHRSCSRQAARSRELARGQPLRKACHCHVNGGIAVQHHAVGQDGFARAHFTSVPRVRDVKRKTPCTGSSGSGHDGRGWNATRQAECSHYVHACRCPAKSLDRVDR